MFIDNIAQRSYFETFCTTKVSTKSKQSAATPVLLIIM